MVGVYANDPGDFPLKFTLTLFQMKIPAAVFSYVQDISSHIITKLFPKDSPNDLTNKE